MLNYILAFPIIFITMMLQMVVVNKLPLLYGYADLLLLVIVVYAMHPQTKRAWFWGLFAGLLYGYVSKLPYIVPIVVFGFIIFAAQYIKSRIWQMPILAYIFIVLIGTFGFQIAAFVALKFTGSSLPIPDSFNLIIIPSVLLNLIFAVPIYYIFTDFLDVVFTKKEKI
jgi:rod shape-determining protein MreD